MHRQRGASKCVAAAPMLKKDDDKIRPVKLPPPRPNGGLYTGEPFLAGAPWRNFPTVPDSGHLIHHNLRSANPPVDALYQYPGGGLRLGNNYPVHPGISRLGPLHQDVLCAPCFPDAPQTQHRFSKYSYVS
jgi:hypothetical protein